MKEKIYNSKLISLAIILAVYAVAGALGYLVFWVAAGLDFVLRMFFADIAATVLVWIAGVIFKNSSAYDPYWSVAPIVMVFGAIIFYNNYSAAVLLTAAVISVWGIRLTGNWIYTFDNLNWQDWRYVNYKKNFPKIWFLINLFGINIMPTLFVFAGMLPVFVLVKYGAAINAGIIAGLCVSVFAVMLQTIADMQMHCFRSSPENKGKINNKGIWSLSRHPNYLGEITFWTGLYITMVTAKPSYFYLFAAPLLILCLFLFISIPLMEKRQLERRPEYAEYKRTTSMLLLFPPRSIGPAVENDTSGEN